MSVKFQFNTLKLQQRRINSKDVQTYESCVKYLNNILKDCAKQVLKLEYEIDDEFCIIDSEETYICALTEKDKLLEIAVYVENLPVEKENIITKVDSDEIKSTIIDKEKEKETTVIETKETCN